MTTEESKRYEIIQDLKHGKIDGSEAAKKLHLSVRQTKRLKAKVVKLGLKGIIHGNRGRVSHNKTDDTILTKVKKYLHDTYADFNPLLAQEKLLELNQIKLSKETVRQIMIEEKLWQSKKKDQVKKHFWRERKDNYGEMEQFDGSYHNWFEGRNEATVGLEQCLLLSVDDATGKITAGVFEYNEGVIPVFKFWKGYFEDKGLPNAIYLDKFSTYKVNHKNAVDNKELMTQFERAMNQLGVRVIHANSPQAKGRVEKMNGTLQRRLVKEMRLNKINTIEDANKFLKEVFIPKFNRQFAVMPKKANDLHQRLSASEKNNLGKILSIQSERVINNDYTVQFKNRYFQLTNTQPTTVYKKDKVTVEEYLNGEIKIAVRNHHLNYLCLPERPKKAINVQLAALTTRQPANWKPPANHPWRRQFLFTKKQPILSAVQ
jgi:hypothetical protein